jgi:hypothetical protein
MPTLGSEEAGATGGKEGDKKGIGKQRKKTIDFAKWMVATATAKG